MTTRANPTAEVDHEHRSAQLIEEAAERRGIRPALRYIPEDRHSCALMDKVIASSTRERAR